MIVALLSALAAALAAVIILRWRVVAERKDDHVATPAHRSSDWSRDMDAAINAMIVRMGALEADHLEVRAAVAHGIEDIERVDNRIKATIRRTTRQLEEAGVESPALAAEAAQLHVLDGGGGDVKGLSPVHGELEVVQSSIPGVTAEELAKVRGNHGAA
jgi:hypothetical protein